MTLQAELGKYGSKKKTVATYDRDKMFVVAKSMDKILVWDLNTLAPLPPLEGIKIDEYLVFHFEYIFLNLIYHSTHPHEKRVTLKSNEHTLVCAFHDRVYAWDMNNLQSRRVICKYPYVMSLALEKRYKYKIKEGKIPLAN